MFCESNYYECSRRILDGDQKIRIILLMFVQRSQVDRKLFNFKCLKKTACVYERGRYR